MSASLYLMTLCIPLATLLLIFGMRYYAQVQQAKARLANDDAYRQVAEKSVATQSATQQRCRRSRRRWWTCGRASPPSRRC